MFIVSSYHFKKDSTGKAIGNSIVTQYRGATLKEAMAKYYNACHNHNLVENTQRIIFEAINSEEK